MESNLPVDNQDIDNLPEAKIYYFKRAPFYRKDNQPMTDEEVSISAETIRGSESGVLLYDTDNETPVGVEVLWDEPDYVSEAKNETISNNIFN